MKTLTVIIREVTTPLPPAAPWPLIYHVKVTDPENDGEILEAVAAHRCNDLGLDEEEDSDVCDEVKDGLELLFAFEGDLTPTRDWRD